MRFTIKETEVVRLVASGAETDEMVARLGISDLTLKTHLRNIFLKTDVRSRAQLVARVLVNVLLDMNRVVRRPEKRPRAKPKPGAAMRQRTKPLRPRPTLACHPT